MNKQEFIYNLKQVQINEGVAEENVTSEEDVSIEDYKLIEEVYTWHPLIKNIGGKQQIAQLYYIGKMGLIREMLPVAKKAKELNFEIGKINNQLKGKCDELKSITEAYL